MVEPIKPAHRAALRDEHEGLDDKMIDRLEQLTIERFQFDPTAEPERIKRIDEEREALLNRTMPRFTKAMENAKKAEPKNEP